MLWSRDAALLSRLRRLSTRHTKMGRGEAKRPVRPQIADRIIQSDQTGLGVEMDFMHRCCVGHDRFDAGQG